MKFYFLIILAIILVSNRLYAVECIYIPKQSADNPYPELSPQGKCGQLIDSDTLQLNQTHFNNLYFAKNGLASIFYNGAAFYVSTSGKVVRTHFFDNGADYFTEGFARIIKDGKYGYIDEQLNSVIEPEYDFAFPFVSGKAIVCNGCQSERVGEHLRMVGGKWGVINKNGAVIIPLKTGQIDLLENTEYKRKTK